MITGWHNIDIHNIIPIDFVLKVGTSKFLKILFFMFFLNINKLTHVHNTGRYRYLSHLTIPLCNILQFLAVFRRKSNV